ncbi:MAG: 5-formyltetrahydrofolate cyclo-ligase [Eubacteriaceae bacterium]|jgi:5-formyltetrahydrofolate cyclo-ligase|nr:5-formyltetrahydrofolate cyclo-ligase [Eubacteriaceae bacterium]
MDKAELRKELLKRRELLAKEEIDEISKLIFGKAISLQCYQRAKIVMLYIPFGNELNTIPFLEKCIEDSKTVVTPICNHKDRSMDLAVTHGVGNMRQTKMGLWEVPREGSEFLDSSALDLILVPGLAFSLDGDRIGYGGGYYDRLFARAPKAIRLAPSFDSFLLEGLPTEEFDLKADIILTEKRSIFIGNSRLGESA